MKKRFSAAILVLVLAQLALTACGTQQAKTGGATDVTGSGSVSAAQTTVNLYSDVPKGNYNGYKFRILNTTYTWAITTIDTAELDGEVINDEIYNRNRSLEDKLGIEFVVTEGTEGENPGKVSKSVSAGEDAFDAVFMGAYTVAPIISNNYFYNLYDVSELNFDKPWWDPVTMSQYTVDGKLFWVHGNLQLMYYEGLWTVMFNKKLVGDFSLTSPYDLVKSGKWTYDTMIASMKAVAEDVNGNGTSEIGDRFGLITHTGSSFAFLHGFGEKLIKQDSSNKPYLTATDERFTSVVDRIKTLYGDTKLTGLTSNVGKNDGEWLFPAFSANQSLYLIEVMGRVRDIRQMDADFGLLPFPKYDESQKNYMSYISPASSALCIPVTNSDIDRTGVIIENMCASSYETVKPAYYDITLQGKRLRDSESEDMLDLMFSNIECELGYVYKWAGIQNTYTGVVTSSKEVTSEFDSVREKVTSEINKTLDALAK